MITQWSFVADTPSTTIVDPGTPNPWYGSIVTSGLVRVTAVVGGALVADSTRITVTPRPFYGIQVDTGTAVATDLLDCDPNPIYAATMYGWASRPGHCDAEPPIYPYPDSASSALGVVTQISSGPNRTLWYANTLKSKIYRRTNVIRDFRSNPPTYPVTPNTIGIVALSCGVIDQPQQKTLIQVDSGCMHQTGATDFRTFVRRHESCHMLEEARALSDYNNVQLLSEIESMVAASSDPVTFRIIFNLIPISNAVANRTQALDGPGGPMFAPWAPTDLIGGWSSGGYSGKGILAQGC
jgi:hypothetical protein